MEKTVEMDKRTRRLTVWKNSQVVLPTKTLAMNKTTKMDTTTTRLGVGEVGETGKVPNESVEICGAASK